MYDVTVTPFIKFEHFPAAIVSWLQMKVANLHRDPVPDGVDTTGVEKLAAE